MNINSRYAVIPSTIIARTPAGAGGLFTELGDDGVKKGLSGILNENIRTSREL